MTFREFYGSFENYERQKCLENIDKQRELLHQLQKAYYADERVPELAKYTLAEILEKMYSAEQSVDMLQRVIDGKQHLTMYRVAWERLRDKEMK